MSLLRGWRERLSEIGEKDGGDGELDVFAPGPKPRWDNYMRGDTDRQRLLLRIPDDSYQFQHGIAESSMELVQGQ